MISLTHIIRQASTELRKGRQFPCSEKAGAIHGVTLGRIVNCIFDFTARTGNTPGDLSPSTVLSPDFVSLFIEFGCRTGESLFVRSKGPACKNIPRIIAG